jgi:uncharacterized protein YrrD
MADAHTQPAIDVGAEVVSSEGEKVGTVSYLVVRPPHYVMTDIVVSTGFLGRDLVVPIDRMAGSQEGAVHLTLGKDEMAKLDDYVEAHYDQPNADWFAGAGMYYPGAGTLWPAGTYYPIPTSVEVNAPPGTVGISEGMDVVSSDGHGVGSVHSAVMAADGSEVDGLVVREGILFHHDVRIPISEVQSIHDSGVVLRATKDELAARYGT